MAFGVSVSVKSGLGVSPVNAIPYVISRVSGLDQGLMTTIIFCAYILAQMILLRRDFKLKSLFQVACAMAFGYFVSLGNGLLAFPAPENYLVRLGLMVISIFLIAMGIMMYLTADLIPQPAEGLCLAIQEKTGWPYPHIKVGFDTFSVSTAALISWLASGEIGGLREGTILAMVGVGSAIGLASKLFRIQLEAFCLLKKNEEEIIKDDKSSKHGAKATL